MGSEIVLTGLDGTNPLGFLAAVGVLELASWRPRGDLQLSWRDATPVITGCERDQLLPHLLLCTERWPEHALARFAYSDDAIVSPASKGAERDVKAPPVLARQAFERWVAMASRDERWWLDGCCALFTDTVADGSGGKAKPSALHFTSGQQRFLDIADELALGVQAERLENALFGPWAYTPDLRNLSWDATQSRDYALRANDPSTEKRPGVPGAHWLAFCGLAAFPVAARGFRLATTAVHRDDRDEVFVWPLWTPPLGRVGVRSLLQRGDLRKMSGRKLAALGLHRVNAARIARVNKGYGVFSPSRTI